MSDADKPPIPPTPPPEDVPAAAPAPLPEPSPGRPPALETDQGFGAGPRLRDLDKDIERELEEAMGGMSTKELLGEPQAGGRRAAAKEGPGFKKGKVLRVHGPDVFIEVPGGRSQGVIPMTQFPEGPPAVGTELEVHYEGYDGANGLMLLSRKGAAQEADWSTVAVGMIVEARVTATNKGGLSVDVNGIRGFMPISQIDLYRVENAEEYVNQRLRCEVTEVKPDERNLVVSRRALLEKEREEARARLWNELAEGQVREGVVRSIRDFGAFVDLGGVDGLLPISQVSWSRIENLNSVLQPGQRIKVIVLKADREHHKVSLGLKQLTTSPWDQASVNYPVNTVVKGKVTRLMDFGAFVEVEPGVEGLIHISELSPQRVRRVGDVVQPGQEVQVMVLKVDPAARKMSLSLKAALPKEAPPEAAEEEEEAVEVKPPRPRTTPLRGGIGDQ
jgi:small subunit ribosomal protein S1